jgi:DNA-binding Xre family transcriptional regulator
MAFSEPPIAPQTLADRAWVAYHALPRDERGRLPSYRSLELAHGLPLAVLSKLFNGERTTVESDTLAKLATALAVSPGWLASSAGDHRAVTRLVTNQLQIADRLLGVETSP